MYYLTRKEFQTLILVVQGKSNKEIAKIQMVNCRTIESHVSSVLQKTDCRSRCELIVLYFDDKEKFRLKNLIKREMLTDLFLTNEGILSPSVAAAQTGASAGYASVVIEKLIKVKGAVLKRSPERVCS